MLTLFTAVFSVNTVRGVPRNNDQHQETGESNRSHVHFRVETTGCLALDPPHNTMRFKYISRNEDITGSMASVTVFPLLHKPCLRRHYTRTYRTVRPRSVEMSVFEHWCGCMIAFELGVVTRLLIALAYRTL